MPMKGEELRAAEAHIARLEEELLRLKDVKRDLQLLREEHRRLRRSAEGRVAKMLSAPSDYSGCGNELKPLSKMNTAAGLRGIAFPRRKPRNCMSNREPSLI